jgi:hypothetical protein
VSEGDENGDVGENISWALKLRKLLSSKAAAGSESASGNLEEAVLSLRGLDSEYGALDAAELLFLVQRLRPAMQRVIQQEGLQGTLTVDQAVAIRVYTVDYPSVYSAINGVMFSPDRRNGKEGVSSELLQAVPYIHFLLGALRALPPQYRYQGRCYRGIRWVFPSPQDHDVVRHFHGKSTLFFYEFKSTSTDKSLMIKPRFCGRTGARTIFEINAVCGYRIEAFSDFGKEESEVLIPPLSEFRIVSCTQLCDPDGPKDLGPDIVVLDQIA